MERNDRCCGCLSLRLGSMISGFCLCVVDVILMVLYVAVFQYIEGITEVMDACFYSFYLLHFALNGSLVMSAWKRSALLTYPWLVGNFLAVLLIIVLMFWVIFFGLAPHYLNNPALFILCILAAVLVFVWIVIWQFHLSLKLHGEHQINQNLPTAPFDEEQLLKSVAQEPKVNDADLPPSYEEAVKISVVANP